MHLCDLFYVIQHEHKIRRTSLTPLNNHAHATEYTLLCIRCTHHSFVFVRLYVYWSKRVLCVGRNSCTRRTANCWRPPFRLCVCRSQRYDCTHFTFLRRVVADMEVRHVAASVTFSHSAPTARERETSGNVAEHMMRGKLFSNCFTFIMLVLYMYKANHHIIEICCGSAVVATSAACRAEYKQESSWWCRKVHVLGVGFVTWLLSACEIRNELSLRQQQAAEYAVVSHAVWYSWFTFTPANRSPDS